MQLGWLGDYRGFIESLIRYANVYNQIYKIQGYHKTSVKCSLSQIQVLEYILENEEKNQNMTEIANRLGITPSAFSKNIKNMVQKGLLVKYRTTVNKKEIIIRSSELGEKVYSEYMQGLLDKRFRGTFKMLDEIPLEYINRFEAILDYNVDSMRAQMKSENQETEKVKLLKIDLL